ncbi:MAG: FecR domain-containing protein [Candidatus Omnitrophica bacterium]|nr:FecR domain-containing protein [Candidatus Omnitrophota bacterium]
MKMERPGILVRVLALSVLVWFAGAVFSHAAETAKVISVTGDVKIVPKGRNIGVDCVMDMNANAGDWVKTGPKSSVRIAFDEAGDNVIKIEENSLVILRMDGYFKIQLLSGEMYAILEDVKSGDNFKVLTPSVVTEAMSSGWGVKSDGTQTNVVVFDNKVFVCGLNKDGTQKEEKFWINEGYQRHTVNFEDPGEAEKAPEHLVEWFKEQVLTHYLEQTLVEREKAKAKPQEVKQEETKPQDEKKETYKPPTANTIIVDGKEVNLLDYLYKKRLGNK